MFHGVVDTSDVFEDDIIAILSVPEMDNTGIPHFAAPGSTVEILYYDGPCIVAKYAAGPMLTDDYTRMAGTVVTYEL